MQEPRQEAPARPTETAGTTDKPAGSRSFIDLPGIPLEEMEDLFPESDSAMDERIARLRELKVRLGSPAESGTESVTSGQFDDVSSVGGGQRQSRSRTVSSESDHEPIMSPIRDVVIPLPDGSALMGAKFASIENLRNSPIPLPDSTGFFGPYGEGCPSPASPLGNQGGGSQRAGDTGAHSYFSSQHGQPHSGETTPVAGTSGFTPITAAESSRTTNTGSFTFYTKEVEEVDNAAAAEVGGVSVDRASDRAYPSAPISREPYTPGSYLANRDKYLGRSSGQDSFQNTSTASGSVPNVSSEHQSSSEQQDAFTSIPAHTYTDGLGGTRTVIPTFPDVVYIIDDLPGIRATVKVKGGVTEHTFKEQDLRRKRETASNTYASSGDLTESLIRESMGKDSVARDSQSRDSLVREVLEREARAAEQKAKPQSTQEWLAANEVEQPIPVDVVLDKGRLSAIRESLSNELATGYSLKDYKDYVAKNYGRDEASRIRDRTPQRFAGYEAQTKSGLGHQEGPSYQPYYVMEDTQSVSSEKDYMGRSAESLSSDGIYSGRRAEESIPNERSYEGVSYRGPGSYAFTDLGSERVYDHPNRSDSMSSDRTYVSTAYPTASSTQRSSGYASEDSASSSEHTYGGRPSQPSRNPEGYRQQQQYNRSDSTDSQGSTSSSYKRERQADAWDRREEPPRRRSLFGDRPSLFNRDGFMELLEDLIYDDKHDRKHDKFGLWERHSSLLRDDNFCRDFFTKDWGMSSHFDDDDFFKDFGRKRRSKTTRTEEQETREEGEDGGHVHRSKRTESMESDMSSNPKTEQPAGPAESQQSSSTSAQGQSHSQQRQHPDSHFSSREPKAGRIFDDARFKFGSFGSFDEEEEFREHTRCERSAESRGSERGYQGNGRGQGRGDGRGTDTLFFRDFDDLIHRFKDLKSKPSAHSFDTKEQGQKRQEPTE